jgi:NADH dehydrogenase
VGAGFGGLAAARRLARQPVDVVVVDRTNHHLFQPLLYQVATGLLSAGQIAPPVRMALRDHPNSSTLLAEVVGFDLPARQLRLRHPDGSEGTLGYDYLVVAAGATDSYFGHDDWARYVFPMKTLAQAVALRGRLFGAYELAAQLDDPAERQRWMTFVVVGAGPTGVELAGQLTTVARQLRPEFHDLDLTRTRIVLVDGEAEPLPSFPPRLRAHVRRKLAELGVDVRLGRLAVGVDADGIDVREHHAGGPDGVGRTERISAGTVVWAAGVQASPLARMLGEATGADVDRQGRVAVAPDCSLPGHPEVFAIGDMVALHDLPGLAEPAMQEGCYVARVIGRRVTGRRPPRRFRYLDLGMMATISPSDAIAEIRGLQLSGLPAQLAWGGVHIAFLVGWGNRVGVLSRWAYNLLSKDRAEREMLGGVGSADLLPSLAHTDEPGNT